MNLLTKWNPFQTSRRDPLRDFTNFERSLERFFGRPLLSPGNGDEAMALAAWEPLTDITETEKEFVVKVEVPEVKKEDVKVTVEDGTLRISGERKEEKEEKNKKFHRIERSYGSFMRAFTLPDSADGKNITADCKDGVLTVHLPKVPAAVAKNIEVKVA